jgi:hypothetical protein
VVNTLINRNYARERPRTQTVLRICTKERDFLAGERYFLASWKCVQYKTSEYIFSLVEIGLFRLLVARLCLGSLNDNVYGHSYWSEFGLGELLTASTSN